AVVTSYCGHVRRWLSCVNRQTNRLTDRRTDRRLPHLRRLASSCLHMCVRACLVCLSRVSFLVSRFSFLGDNCRHMIAIAIKCLLATVVCRRVRILAVLCALLLMALPCHE